MYLSKIVLDIAHPSVRQALRDVNDMHRNLMAGFLMDADAETPRAGMNILYRLVEKRDGICLLVSSAEMPDAAALAKRGFHTDETMMKDIAGLYRIFSPDMMLRFELLASPCIKRSGEGNSRREYLKTA